MKKSDYKDSYGIVVNHKHYPGEDFVFYCLKKAPQIAEEADAKFLGLPEDARPEESRHALIEAVSLLQAKEPEGFEDFPKDQRPLNERFVEFFDDETVTDFESIMVTLWRKYRGDAVPTAYSKSV